MKNKLVSFITRLNAKPIEANPSIIEDILGIPITLKDFSDSWEEEGIFVKENEDYTFLSRHYSDPDKNGRGNMIRAKDVIPEDSLVKEDDSHYRIKFKNRCSESVYDKGDLNINPEKDIWGLRESFIIYDKLLTFSRIPSIRRVN